MTVIANLVANDTYHGKPVEMLECIGHIQKRVGGKAVQVETRGLKDVKNLVVLRCCVIMT